MTNPVSKPFPFAGLSSYAGTIDAMPNGSFGWTSPNRLRRDGDHLFFERCTVLKTETADDATLAVVKVDDLVHVYDDNVFMSNRWWNYDHYDSYSYPHDYGHYVRSLNRGVERHRDPTYSGRIIGNCAWGLGNRRFAGPLHSMSIGSWGFVDMKQLGRSVDKLYLRDGTEVHPSLENETCLQVIRFNDGFYVFDGDVPPESRWWDRPHRDNYDAFRSPNPTHVRGLFREHQWRADRHTA